MDVAQPFDSKSNIEWQIEARAKIQKLLVRCQEFLKRYPELPLEPDPPKEVGYWIRMCWIVDAAFSLWRSAFLTDTPGDRAVVFDHMQEFIKKVLEHNAISFLDDHRMRGLVVGYYNANAKYRIRRLYETSGDTSLTEMATIQAVATLDGDLARRDQRDLWEIYHAALSDLFDWFEKKWLVEARPLQRRANEDKKHTHISRVANSTAKPPSENQTQ